jgi:Ca-activated chloride channel family protein
MPDGLHEATVEERSSGGRLVTTDGRTLPLRGVTLSADASGGLARTVLEQRFVNPHAEPLRVTYLVPLPVDGALAGYAIRIGDRRIVGEVDRVEAARERFETALIEGRTAGLVDQERPNLFTLELGNVPPGAEVVAALTIDQRLAWLGEGAWEWRFPTVVAPRYLGDDGRVPDAERVTVDVAETSVPARASVGLHVRDTLGAGHPPASPSHSIAVTSGPSGWQVSAEDVALDRDVVVRWRTAQAGPSPALDTARPPEGHARAGAAYGLLTVLPPAPEAGAPAVARDLIVLIDTSGSMEGEPLAQARTAARALVQGLTESDRLEMLAFASAPRRWRRGPEPATEAARRDALAWLDGLVAEGGTEMGDAVTRALRPLRRDAQRQVVLITDGQIGFEREIVEMVSEDLPAGSRLHVVGVGSAVNRALTAPAARAGRGVEIIIGLGEAVAPPVARLLAATQAPLLTDVVLSGSALQAHAPAAVPDVHAGAPLRVALELAPEGGDVVVQGRMPAGPWEARLTVAPLAAGQGTAAVVSLYGREAVEDLEVRRAAGDERVAQQIERLGLEFQIATARTSWVAVADEPSVDPTQPTRRERMPHALPHGMSLEGLGLGRRLAVPRLSLRLGAPLESRMSVGVDALTFGEAPALLLTDSVPVARERVLRHRMDGSRPRARLVLRKGRELTFEITIDAALDWQGEDVRLLWRGGVNVAGAIVEDATTARGPVPAGATVRLSLRLDQDAPEEPPFALVIQSQDQMLRVFVTRG